MAVTASQIKEYVKFVKGNLSLEVTEPVAVHKMGPKATVFVSTEADLKSALKTCQTIIALDKLPLNDLDLNANQVLFSTANIKAALVEILPLFDQKSQRWAAEIHKTAQVHSTARIGKNVRIGPYSVISEGVQLGDDCTLGAHVVLEKDCQVGAKSFLHPFVVIGARCQIGAHNEIHSHTVIGSDGFGYHSSKSGHSKVPQIGIVVTEDHVEIGGNCAIDRATLGDTRIGAGTKLDNLVHIAHNCKIGKNCLLTAGFLVAGSTTIGDNFACGGGVKMADHLTITDNVTVGGGSIVIGDVTEPGPYTGYPLEKFTEGKRTIASLPHIKVMRKQLHQIMKKLGISSEDI